MVLIKILTQVFKKRHFLFLRLYVYIKQTKQNMEGGLPMDLSFRNCIPTYNMRRLHTFIVCEMTFTGFMFCMSKVRIM